MVFSRRVYSFCSTSFFFALFRFHLFLLLSQLTAGKGGEVETRNGSSKVKGGRGGGAEEIAPETLVRRLDARDRQASMQRP